uniref:Holocytochrome c-type synthase n=1 Tax=Alexandrium monilatum TaxID=311494 RepID=A0A7S4SND9_9DINO
MATSACPLGHTRESAPPKGGEERANSSGLAGTAADSSSSSSSTCPMHRSAASADAPAAKQGTGTAASAEAAAQLNHERVESTIPSASGEPFWYPSEKQFYGSAVAKGHQVDPQDMNMVVAIHNAVNERTWQEILRYEHLHSQECPTPRLLRFAGLPGELSPKARLASLLGTTQPFDRHDWHVDRCGTPVRYLVDFYDGKPSPTHPVSIHIDARPEVSWGGVRDRLRLWMRDSGLL